MKTALGRKNYYFGFENENKALTYLKNLNYTILKQNYKSSFGEIDIIATKDDILHFFEVKSSKNYEAHYRITKSKLIKLSKTIACYFLENLPCDFQLDAIIICNDEFTLIENISL